MEREELKKKKEEILAMVKNPLNWMDKKERREFEKSGLPIDDWIRQKHNLSVGEWIAERKNILKWNNTETKTGSDVVKKTKLPLIKKTKKKVEKNVFNYEDVNPKINKKELILKNENRLELFIDNFKIVPTKIHRSLREDEVDVHRYGSCRYFKKCSKHIIEIKGKYFSCKNCPQFNNPDLVDPNLREYAYCSKYH